MTKIYTAVPNDKRQKLIRLIHEEGMTIARAARIVNIGYPIAKVINRVYTVEGRTDKKIKRSRRTAE